MTVIDFVSDPTRKVKGLLYRRHDRFRDSREETQHSDEFHARSLYSGR